MSVIALVIIALQGCVAYRTARISPRAAQSHLEVGEQVIVVLKSGKKYRAVIKAITNTELVTRNGRYAWTEVSYLAHEEYDAARSTLKTVGAGLAVGIVSMLLFALIIEDAY